MAEEITTEYLDHLYRCKKWVYENLKWERKGKFMKFKATVECENGELLVLYGTAHRRYSFSLVFKDKVVRRFDYHHVGKVSNGCIITFGDPHKHYIDIDNSREEIYPVDNIPTDDVNKGLQEFLRECNIKRKGVYDPLLKGGWGI